MKNKWELEEEGIHSKTKTVLIPIQGRIKWIVGVDPGEAPEETKRLAFEHADVTYFPEDYLCKKCRHNIEIDCIEVDSTEADIEILDDSEIK